MSTNDQVTPTPKPSQAASKVSNSASLSDSDNEFLTQLDQALTTIGSKGESSPILNRPKAKIASKHAIDHTQPSSYKAEISNVHEDVPLTKEQEETQHETAENPYFYISDAGYTVPAPRAVSSEQLEQTATETPPEISPELYAFPYGLKDKESATQKPRNTKIDPDTESHITHLTEIWGTIALWSALACIIAFGVAIWYTNEMADRMFRLEKYNEESNSKVNELLARIDIIKKALVNAEQRIKQVDQRLEHQIILFTRYTVRRSEGGQTTRQARINSAKKPDNQPLPDALTEDAVPNTPRRRRRGYRRSEQ